MWPLVIKITHIIGTALGVGGATLAVRRESIGSKRPLVWLSGVTWFLALFITGAGILVSGAV